MTLVLAWPALGAPPEVQTEADEYTRYELLAPETGQFRILYEVSATTPGARFYFNPIRKGSEVTNEAVYDRASGRAVVIAPASPPASLPASPRPRPPRQARDRPG